MLASRVPRRLIGCQVACGDNQRSIRFKAATCDSAKRAHQDSQLDSSGLRLFFEDSFGDDVSLTAILGARKAICRYKSYKGPRDL